MVHFWSAPTLGGLQPNQKPVNYLEKDQSATPLPGGGVSTEYWYGLNTRYYENPWASRTPAQCGAPLHEIALSFLLRLWHVGAETREWERGNAM